MDDCDQDGDDADDDRSMTIVKMGLRRAMRLSKPEYERFTNIIETYVTTISKMLHRAGIALLLHLLRLARDDLPIPNLFDQKDTYWKDWLKLSPELCPPNDPAWAAFKVATGEIDASQVHDQVIAYAAITFKTVVLNNAWVPLVPRIARLTKAVVRSHASDAATASASSSSNAPSAFKIIAQIRSSKPSYDGLPAWAVDFVKDVRARLNLKDGTTYLFDDYAKKKKKPNVAFADLFKFNYWLQQQLVKLGAKRISLSPLFRVRRAFVRLDKKVLISIAKRAIPNDRAIKALDALEKEHCNGDDAKNPDKGIHSLIDRLPDRLEKETVQDYDTRVAPIVASNLLTKAGEAYKKRKAVYTQVCDAKRAVASSLFKAPKKTGHRFDGSITTDGVAACLQYSRPTRAKSSLARQKKPRQQPGQRKAKATDEIVLYPSLPTFDRVSNTLVAGLDPGRLNVATIAYVLDEESSSAIRDDWAPSTSTQDNWTLSRSSYYVGSGIRSLDMAKNRRYAAIHRFWQGDELEDDQGDDIDQTEVIAALRTAQVDEVMAYLSRYALIREEWWALALRRRESRADLQRYSGKRKVLDGFFSQVKRTLEQRIRPSVNIQIAYGHAYQTMKPTGKGEVAVPVHSTFKSCSRVFGPSNVVPTDEYGSTAFEWDTGDRKLAVYRKVDGLKCGKDGWWSVGVSRFGTTAAKRMPRVEDAKEVDVVKDYIVRRKSKIKTAHSGLYDPMEAEAKARAKGAESEETRYLEVRGLRFSTKTRSYLDRDLHAARTIGRLRTVELMGRARPTPFCRGLG